jgi:NAD(P)-dependent dehydrogenase (short-subunit alcohol dehydrogenase family)
LFDVARRVTFVTGGAGGLGLAIAEAMAEGGARVTIADIDEQALRATASRMQAAGFALDTAVLDVADSAQLNAAIDRTAAKYGRLDVVFANAGISAGPGFALSGAGRITEVKRESWRRVLDINLDGVFATMQRAAHHMRSQKSGRIVVIASIAALEAEPLVGYAYVASKAAVANLVRQAALELARDNILVNAIAPGPFLTNIAGGRLHDPAMANVFARVTALRRLGEPDEIKGLAIYLASDASSYMTGAIIPLDGGATAG